MEDFVIMSNKKPKVKLIGIDGNSYSIMGACQRAAKKFGMPQEDINKILNEMMSGDYDHLLQTAMKYFDVV